MASAKVSAKKKEDAYGRMGWMVSDSFWKRAVGTFLYSLAGGIIVYVIMLLLIIIVMAALALFGKA